MKLELKIADEFCVTEIFRINGIEADSDDFGVQGDEAFDDAVEDDDCGDMQFARTEPTADVLAKYGITKTEYHAVAEKLEEGLSFGSCGLCV